MSTVIPNATTRGLVEPGDPNVTVCLLPSTELVFDGDVEYESALGFLPVKKVGENTASFRRVNPDRRRGQIYCGGATVPFSTSPSGG